jgi:hypothetical protein
MKKNMKFTRSLLLGVMALTLMMTGCKKDKEEIIPEGTASFVDKTWKLDAMTIDPAIDWDEDGVPDTDILGLMDECDIDDLITLRKDGKTITNFGKAKCDPTEPNEATTGSWAFDPVSKKMTLNHDEGDDEEWMVVQNDGNTLKMKGILPNVTPEYTITMTLKKVK